MITALGVLVSIIALAFAVMFGVCIGMYDECKTPAERRENRAAGWFSLCLAVLLWGIALCMVH